MSGWDGIDEFVAVATAGSFIGGARALGMSPSHISRAIHDMEQRLDTRLFHRTTRVVRLSDTGRSLLDHCRQLIADREDMLALIHEESEPQGPCALSGHGFTVAV
jgi:DNA-binding transcriptional LysR family regulator